MPRPDPIPSPHKSVSQRFWRIFRLHALMALVVAVLAAFLVSRGDPTLHIHMIIATALGAFMIVLIGSSLMTLLFISNSSGHDDDAASFHQENDKQ